MTDIETLPQIDHNNHDTANSYVNYTSFNNPLLPQLNKYKIFTQDLISNIADLSKELKSCKNIIESFKNIRETIVSCFDVEKINESVIKVNKRFIEGVAKTKTEETCRTESPERVNFTSLKSENLSSIKEHDEKNLNQSDPRITAKSASGQTQEISDYQKTVVRN